MSYEEAIERIAEAVRIEKKLSQKPPSTQVLYDVYNPDPSNVRGLRLGDYMNRHTDANYIDFLLSIKDFETWEDVKTFYDV